MREYENIDELREVDNDFAENVDYELSPTDGILVFDSPEEFAEYELYDGWFEEVANEMMNFGPINPLDFIDLSEFANALMLNWDESVHAVIDGKIVEVY